MTAVLLTWAYTPPCADVLLPFGLRHNDDPGWNGDIGHKQDRGRVRWS
ncbi:hypothetical protein LQV63_30240 [Paenibacillus profundus]|uniref:Uncharacterized protein n=1 Tax=Paenibacillus profundus TaxID=1173085 RepID=A0ABS8YSB1_9BACL|nr:hypothetical protein [Paenibacillus profundus]MCE5173515.1 hypothetical protein [Paenibacillus profundus]